MKFTVIVPAYNSGNHIRTALESIRNQSFTDYELIVVCDSCEDNTELVASDYADKVIRINDHNDGMARTAGLDAAVGEWVLFLDDDDWFLHEFVFDDLAMRSEEKRGEVICFAFIWRGVGYAEPRGNRGTLFPSVWSKCWRRDVIGETRFPNIYSISDYHFHCRMMEKRPALDIYDRPMVYYNYLRKGSISEQIGRTAEGTKKYLRRGET